MQFISVVFIIVCICSNIAARDVTLDQQWKLWKDAHKKHYFDAEEHHRRTIWQSNLKRIEEHNRRADRGIHTYWLGMNQFADLTNLEFGKMLIRKTKTKYHQKYQTLTRDVNAALPDTVDWRAAGFVTEVKDQGQCPAPSSIAVVGAIESSNAIKTGKLVPLSVQQTRDCAVAGGTDCESERRDIILQYLTKVGGLESEEDYPYTIYRHPCAFNGSKVVANVSGFSDIKSKDESALQVAIATIGPVAVAIDASQDSFQFYKSGVYNEPRCSQTELDLDVLVVGYGHLSSVDYWLVRNSWGTSWGDRGYIKMARNRNNQCGIATAAVFPLV